MNRCWKRSAQVALAAIKYGDLSNQASKDYIFDTDKFTSFEGDTGPYILYTIVRIKSILKKYQESLQGAAGAALPDAIAEPRSSAEKALMRDLAGFGAMMENAYEELAPPPISISCPMISTAFIMAQEFSRKRMRTRRKAGSPFLRSRSGF